MVTDVQHLIGVFLLGKMVIMDNLFLMPINKMAKHEQVLLVVYVEVQP